MSKSDWRTPENIGQLGTMTDLKLAEKFGVSTHTILLERKRLGILSNQSRKLASFDFKILGKMPDEKAAAKIGCSIKLVEKERKKRGIPSYKETQSSSIDWSSVGLGTESDSAIAKKLGVSVITVFKRRKSLGIQASQPKTTQRLKLDLSWSEVNAIDQSEFISLICEKSALNRKQLAAAAKVSYSRMQKWAATGSGRENLREYMRWLLFLSAQHAANAPAKSPEPEL